jgi:hypothetical protein
MSDHVCTTDAALLLLQERAQALSEEIETHQRALDLANARHEELLWLIAQIGRKSRPRKPRVAAEAVPEPTGDPAPSVFGAPSGAIVEAA